MDLKRKTIEDFKRQIDEGKFASNNDLVMAIRDLYNNAKMAASTNPLLEQFLNENDYTEFTKDVTSELVNYYKQYKENEKSNTTDLNSATIEGQTIDSSQISQVNADGVTYYTVKDDDGDFSVFAANDNDIINQIAAESIGSDEDITHVAKEVIEEEKVEVNLTGLEQFERQRNLSTEDHTQAALARSMQTYTGDTMAVNSEHDIIFNTESGELSKIDETGKVMTYGSDSVEGPSMSTGEQFTLSNDTLDTLSIEDIDMMLADPDKYNLSPETIEGLKQARDNKALQIEEKPMQKDMGFQKVLKPPVNFKTSAFVDVLLVALVCFGFSSLVLLRLLFY